MDPRARQYMYVQDVDHLKIDFKELPNILNKSAAEQWAFIVHDKDMDEKGNPTRSHVHVILKYAYPQILSHVVRIFNDKPQYLQIWKGRINNAYSYLIHRTADAQNKYQYSPGDVTASFDFVAKIKKIEGKVNHKTVNRLLINHYLDDYAAGALSITELEQKIGIVQVAKHKTVIDHIDQINAARKHKVWLANFAGKRMECLWLCGDSGTGKTSYAHWITRNDEVANLGSSRDYFQEYHGEKVVILNDLSPNDFNYGDLLRLLDPYEHDKMAPRRYNDVPLNLEMLIITTL